MLMIPNLEKGIYCCLRCHGDQTLSLSLMIFWLVELCGENVMQYYYKKKAKKQGCKKGLPPSNSQTRLTSQFQSRISPLFGFRHRRFQILSIPLFFYYSTSPLYFFFDFCSTHWVLQNQASLSMGNIIESTVVGLDTGQCIENLDVHLCLYCAEHCKAKHSLHDCPSFFRSLSPSPGGYKWLA